MAAAVTPGSKRFDRSYPSSLFPTPPYPTNGPPLPPPLPTLRLFSSVPARLTLCGGEAAAAWRCDGEEPHPRFTLRPMYRNLHLPLPPRTSEPFVSYLHAYRVTAPHSVHTVLAPFPTQSAAASYRLVRPKYRRSERRHGPARSETCRPVYALVGYFPLLIVGHTSDRPTGVRCRFPAKN